MKLKAELAALQDDTSCVAFAVHLAELPAPLVFARCDQSKRRCGRCGNGKIPEASPAPPTGR